MATLVINANHNFTGETLDPDDPIDALQFNAAAQATFSGSQFGTGDGLIASNVQITGSASGINLILVQAISGALSAAAWQFVNWGPEDSVILIGDGNDNTLTGSSRRDVINGGTGADTINAGDDDDVIFAGNFQIEAGEHMDGGAGTDTLRISGNNDLTSAGTTITNVEILELNDPDSHVTASAAQFGGAGDFTTVTGDTTKTQSLTVNGSTVNLSGVTFNNWGGANQTITINGTNAAVNLLTGSSQNDILNGTGSSVDAMRGGGGADTLNGGNGDDLFDYSAAGEVASGEVISGGGGADTIQLQNAGSNDFSLASITSVETLDFVNGTSTATFSGTQFGTGAIVNVSGGTGTDTLIVNAASDVDLSDVNFTSWTNGTDTIIINGSASGEELTGTGFDSNFSVIITGGGGGDFINGTAGDDVFRYTATGDVTPSEIVNAVDGTDTLEITGGTHDFSTGAALNNIEALRFTGTGSATFNGLQIGLGSSISAVTGSAGTDAIIANAFFSVNGGASDLSGVGFTSWTDGVDTITINGLSDGDDLVGSSKNDIINGLNGADTITGGDGADTMSGGAGDDTFVFTSGVHVDGEAIDGGADTDTLRLEGSGAVGFSFNLASLASIERVVLAGTVGRFALFNGSQFGAGGITTLVGSANIDTIEVNDVTSIDLSTIFTSWSADDETLLNGTAAADSIAGSPGKDTIFGEGGADHLSGGDGDDVFSYLDPSDLANGETIDGGIGIDTIRLSFGASNSSANLSTMTITGIEALSLISPTFSGFRTTTLSGTQIGTGKIVTVSGSSFMTESLVVNAASNVDLSGVSFSLWQNGVDSITINGTAAAESLTGSNQNDVINSSGGNDTSNGGDGDDFLYVNAALDVVNEAAGDGNDRVFASVSYTLKAGQEIEKLTTDSNAGTGSINLTGNELANIIFGNAGANSLDGKGGADDLSGLAGDDFYFVDNALDVVNEAASGGNDRVFASVSFTLKAGQEIEKLTTGSNAGTGAINLTGNELANIIFGNAGANTLDGKGGADDLNGLGGGDFYNVDNALDVVNEAVGAGTDRVFASVSYTLKAGQEIEKFTTDSNSGTGAINLTGNELANIIFGNAGANTLDGKGGADDLNGLGGDDFYNVDNALDVVNEASGAGNDRVFASVSYTLKAGQSIEKLTTDANGGTGAINLTGNEIANSIFGNAGGNTLNGGAGKDSLTGLGGHDHFRFDTPLNATTNVDTVSDFTVSTGSAAETDKIDLAHAIFTTLASGALAPSAFTTSAPTNASQRIVYNTTTGALSYDNDGNGANAAVQFALLSAHPALTAADILVV